MEDELDWKFSAFVAIDARVHVLPTAYTAELSVDSKT